MTINSGGYHLDVVLAEHFCSEFEKAKGLRVRDDKEAWHDFIARAEGVKKRLSKLRIVRSIALPWKGHSVNVDVEVKQFEDLIADKITRTEMLADNALDNVHLKPNDIDKVLLVGGSTRIPAVKRMLAKKFGKEPMAPVNVDEAVALGAAIQAGIIMHERGLVGLPPAAAAAMGKARIRDVATHAYGTTAVGVVGAKLGRKNVILIKKDDPLPASVTQEFATIHDSQEEVECDVTQAANNEETDPEFVKVIWSGTMPLPTNLPAGSPLNVTFSYDANMRMHCSFKEPQSGRVKELDLDLGQRDSEANSKSLDNLEAELSDLTIE